MSSDGLFAVGGVAVVVCVVLDWGQWGAIGKRGREVFRRRLGVCRVVIEVPIEVSTHSRQKAAGTLLCPR